MSELDPFFNDEALVKGITKDSRRLRPNGTVCVMPKYTSAIGNELVYCGTKSPLGMCNRKGTSTETSCRGLWVKHISPDEQSLTQIKFYVLHISISFEKCCGTNYLQSLFSEHVEMYHAIRFYKTLVLCPYLKCLCRTKHEA